MIDKMGPELSFAVGVGSSMTRGQEWLFQAEGKVCTMQPTRKGMSRLRQYKTVQSYGCA